MSEELEQRQHELQRRRKINQSLYMISVIVFAFLVNLLIIVIAGASQGS